MLNPHRQSVLTNACIKPSVDPITRTPGTIYEPKGQVRLLGLLSENISSQQEDYLDAGDGLLICMKRAKKKALRPLFKGCWEPEQDVPDVSETSDVDPDQDVNKQLEPAPQEQQSNEPPPPEPPKIVPRQGSFPFHWMWESFSIKGQTICQDQVLDKTKKLTLPRAVTVPSREAVYNPDAILGSPVPKESHCLGVSKSARTPEVPCSRPQRYLPHMALFPRSSLLPLFWKMEARSDARKRQLRQERRHWLHLTQQLLNLEGHRHSREKHLSLEELEEKLRAEMLCLATEPEEPVPPKEKRKSKTRSPTPKEEPTFKPIINQKVPNFKHLQKRFQEQLEQKKEQGKPTICKPFHLHSSSSQPLSEDEGKKKPQEDLFQDLRRLWSIHWRVQSCPDFEPSMAPQVMSTKTSDKRQEANRLLLLEWERREQQEKHRAELRRLKAQHMQREVAKCLAAYRNKGRSLSFQKRREELRKQEKQRMEEYMIQLQEIQDRVESRPYLFERVMQVCDAGSDLVSVYMPPSESESETEDEQLTQSGRVAPLAVEEIGKGQSQAGQSRRKVEQGRGGSDEEEGPPSSHPKARREERRKEQRGLRG